mgnify:CR=1 FL=1
MDTHYSGERGGGTQGSKGDKRDPGLQGPQGPRGDKGDIGSQRPRGLRGLKGDKGDAGTISGDIDMNGNRIISLPAPSTDTNQLPKNMRTQITED